MDPQANLIEQINLARRILAAWDNEEPMSEERAARLAELVTSLDEWLTSGGVLPQRWIKARKPSRILRTK